jgi:hypothetical protein
MKNRQYAVISSYRGLVPAKKSEPVVEIELADGER